MGRYKFTQTMLARIQFKLRIKIWLCGTDANTLEKWSIIVTANKDNGAFLGVVNISAYFHKVGECCLENTYIEGVSKN